MKTAELLPLPLQEERYAFASWPAGLHCFRIVGEDRPPRRVCFSKLLLDPKPPHGLSSILETVLEIAGDQQDIRRQIARRDRIPPPPAVDYAALIEAWHAWADGIPASCRHLAAVLPKRYQYAALESMRHVPEFREFLAQEQDSGGLWFPVILWALGRVTQRSFAERLELSRRCCGTCGASPWKTSTARSSGCWWRCSPIPRGRRR
ncbi:hypothetical protein MIN45_P0629 [Methylomarinovum tepidoasis]|uniref:Uncharacterized protein n=1 Tax=Methylomarinovum tepidoasis TaxID=2840183 RepID=A0AAU9C787_9GAMM|nr:hypothetical protein [Methylomarinovum sp. IN45]BCX88260.1 hypothetical protein MIN45_P0629 [Methylomarinovum sp. IN45]